MRREFRNMMVRYIMSAIFLLIVYILVISFREKALEMLKELPQNFKEMVGEEFQRKLETDPVFYIVSQWNWKNLAQMIPVVSIVMGFPMISREIERGTIYFLFSNRKRSSIFFEKFFTGALALTILIFFATILPVFNGVPLRMLLLYSVHAVLASLFWYSLAFFLSCFFSDQVKVLILSLGIFVVTAVLEGMKVCQLNVLRYIADEHIYTSGTLDVIASLKYSIAVVLLFFGAMFNVKRMEV